MNAFRRRGSGAVILLSFITLTILFIMGMWQWFTVSFTRSRRRAKEFTLARLLGESALNEVEAVLREQINIARDDEKFRPLHLGKSIHSFTYEPVETLALAQEVFKVSNPFDEDVLVAAKTLPILGNGVLSEGFPRPDLPDETEGVFTAMVRVTVGATTLKVHRVLEFKQLRMCPPWGFDQTVFAALNWKYYHERFSIFTEEILTFLAQRKAFRDTASSYLREKRAACDWAIVWHGTVSAKIDRMELPPDALERQLDANAQARSRWCGRRGVALASDAVYQNLSGNGVAYFNALGQLSPTVTAYRGIESELDELPAPPESMPRFRQGSSNGPGEHFEGWMKGGGALYTAGDYRDRHWASVFTLPGSAGVPAPIFVNDDDVDCSSETLAFHNRCNPFEENAELEDFGKLFSCPPPSKAQIWAFEFEGGLDDAFRTVDLDAWSQKKQPALELAYQTFLDHYRQEVGRHDGKLRIGNGPRFTEVYLRAKKRLSLEYQKGRVGFVFRTPDQFSAFLASLGPPTKKVLAGAYMIEQDVELDFHEFAGQGFIVAPRITLPPVKASSGPDQEHLILLGNEGIHVKGSGSMEAGLLAPEGTLRSDGPLQIRGCLVVKDLGGGSAEVFEDELETSFKLKRESSFEYVDRNSGALGPGSFVNDFSFIMVEPSPAITAVLLER